MNKKVIYVSADWCGPCKAYKPILEKVTSDLKIPVQYVNADYDVAIVEKYGIQSIPTTICVSDNTMLFKYSGVMTEAQLKSNLTS
jgi:thioredoxin-like negative regulator of GroEL